MSDSRPNHDSTSKVDVWDDSRITAYVMGELPAEEASHFESKMQADADLQAAVDAASSVTGQLKQMYAGEQIPTLDQQRRESILASQDLENKVIGVRPHDAAEQNPPGNRRSIATWILAAAAVIIITISIVPAIKSPPVALQTTDPPNTNRPSDERAVTSGFESQDQTQSIKEFEGESTDSANTISEGLIAESAPKPVSNFASGPTATTWEENLSVAVPVDKKSLEKTELSVLETNPIPDPRVVRFGDEEMAGKKIIGKLFNENRFVEAKESGSGKTDTLYYGVPELSKDLSGPRPTSNEPASGANQNELAKVDGLSVLPRQSRQTTDFYFESRGLSKQELNRQNVGWFVKRSKMQSIERMPTETRSGDRFDPILENDFIEVTQNPLSTVSVDVDTASYSKIRRVLSEGRLPSADAVRIEEMVNYFDYQYKAPGEEDGHPFSTDVTITECPWNEGHRLARVALQGKRINAESRPACNLVFLLDVSGSMNRPNKLPLVVEGMKMLTSQLHKDDRVAIVVYAGAAGLVLESTPARKQKKIMQALSQLSAGGSTAGGAGIQLAYSVARDHFLKDGVNRVILCTDGDFNVGISNTDQLVNLITEEASDGVFLTALGFGMGNHNDAMLEQISGKGNGNYAFIDTVNEARKVLVRETDATLVTIAKDVKLQIEFNPRFVSRYRLIGYENRVLAKEDFLNDTVDAGEIGAGHQVTALYELVPVNDSKEDSDDDNQPETKSLRYQQTPTLTPEASRDESLTVNLRYKLPSGTKGIDLVVHAKDGQRSFEEADLDFRFAAAVASFGMQLRNSKYAGDWNLKDVKKTAQSSLGEDEYDLRSEFVQMVQSARNLSGN